MNIVLFNFFQGATGAAVTSVVVRENLVRKMHFPRLVIPLAVVCTAGMQLVLNLVVVLVFMLIYGIEPRVTWLLLPVIALAFFVFACGVSMLLSALYVRYRDVAPIWSVISQALFYASPVFITIESIEQHGHAHRPLLPVQPARRDPPAGPPLDARRQPGHARDHGRLRVGGGAAR